MTRIGIVVFPGSNCDRDCAHVLRDVLEADVHMIWHKQTKLPALDALVLPGGFSYGDYLRPGAGASISPVMPAIVDFARQGGAVLGICNGFQVLLELGLLPGALMRNASLRFVCKPVHIACQTDRTVCSRFFAKGSIQRMPVAHAHGQYYIDDAGLQSLVKHKQIVWRYCAPDGQFTPSSNPNGSVAAIAGICNKAGNVVGLMPHPERASESILGSVDGRLLFESFLGAKS